jgi:hypothetical protein
MLAPNKTLVNFCLKKGENMAKKVMAHNFCAKKIRVLSKNKAYCSVVFLILGLVNTYFLFERLLQIVVSCLEMFHVEREIKHSRVLLAYRYYILRGQYV